MGVGDERHRRPTARFDSRELAKLAEADLAPSTELHPTLPAADPLDPLLRPRTATVHDPLTTGLLAEVARNSRTIEVSPEQIAAALEIEPATEPEPAIELTIKRANGTTAPPVPSASPRLVRR